MSKYILIILLLVMLLLGCNKPSDMPIERQNYFGDLDLNGTYFGENLSLLFWPSGILFLSGSKQTHVNITESANYSISLWGLFDSHGDSLNLHYYINNGDRIFVEKAHILTDTSLIVFFQNPSPSYSTFDTFYLDRAYQKPDSSTLKYYKVMEKM